MSGMSRWQTPRHRQKKSQNRSPSMKEIPLQAAEPPKYVIRPISMARYVPDLSARHVIDGMLYRGEVSVLYGPSNSGKSAVVIRLAQSVASGERVLGAEVQKGGVFYVAAEAPLSVRSRAHLILPEDDARDRFLVVAGRPNLSDDEYVRTLIAAGREAMSRFTVPLALIVFDTGARSFGGADENSNEQMTRVIDRANEIAVTLNVHVMIVHHTGKEGDRGARGASAIRDACETEIRCTYSENGGLLEITKQRNHRKGPPLRFELRGAVLGHDNRGKEMTAVVADFVAPAGEQSSGSERPITALMSALLTVLLHEKSPSGLSTAQLHERLPAQILPAVEVSKLQRKVADACDALVAAGLIEKAKSGNLNMWRYRH